MQLERIAITLRPRSGWEAIDMGFGMARAWWPLCFGAWWIPVLPIAIALHLAFIETPWVALLLLWWLKPLFDRFVLYALGRRCFGEQTTLVQLLGAWREILSPSLLWSLTLGRLSPARSYMLPVFVLERQRGRASRERRRLLARRHYGNASGLTLVCVHLELLLQLGLAMLVGVLLQPGEDPFRRMAEGEFFAEESWWTWSDSIYALLAMGLIEPLYVAGGFSLYLNRRVILEGWDVELALKRLARRLAPVAPLLLAVLLALVPPQAAAQQPAAADGDRCVELLADYAAELAEERGEPEDVATVTAADQAQQQRLARCRSFDVPPLQTEARAAIEQILADPVFGQMQQVERWRLRADIDDVEVEQRREPGGWEQFLELLASLWQLLTWVGLAVLLLFLGRAMARHWGGTQPAQEEAAPSQLFGLSITPESLPEDVSGAAAALLAQGQHRAALALLYRAALSRLVHRHGLRLPAGATEGDVLLRSRGRLAQAALDYLGALLKAWVDLAYAERQPDGAALARLIGDFDAHFPAATAQAVPA